MTAPRLTHAAHGGRKVPVAMRASCVVLVVSLVVGALGGPARAEGAPDTLPPFLAALPSLPPGHDEHTAWRLELGEALRLAMQQNLGISVQRKAVETARLGARAATGDLYEPRVGASYSHGGTSGATHEDGTLSLTQKLPTGASLSLGMKASDGGAPSSTDPALDTHGAGVSFSVTQPLLRGFSRDLVIPRAQILTAQIASETARGQLEVDAATLVQHTETAYWAVVAALYSYGVQRKAQQLAEATVTLTRRKVDAGMAAGSELTGAESTFAASKLTVLQQEAAVEDAWDALRTVMNLPRDQWNRPILPTDMPRLTPAEPPSDEQALEAAIQHRPELALLALQLKASDLAARITANDRLPQIDLGLSGSLSGQGTSYGGAVSDLGRHDRDWSVMLNLSWTPLGRGNHARAEMARIQREVNVANQAQQVQEIWNQVRAAVRRQRNAARQVTFALESLTLVNKYLEAENRNYLAGSSSSLSIAQLQSRLADAEERGLRALLDNESTQAALLLATGQLLEHRHIRFEVGEAR
jgi:multidrug efflux system outer membrane protein